MKAGDQDSLTAVFSVQLAGIVIVLIMFIYLVIRSSWKRTLAAQGDEKAAYTLLLPGYRPIYRAFIVLYFVLLAYPIVAFKEFALDKHVHLARAFHFLQGASAIMLISYTVVPLLLMQVSVSWKAFKFVLYITVPWLILSLVLMFLIADRKMKDYDIRLFGGLWLITITPAMIVSGGIWMRIWKHRVNLIRSVGHTIPYV